MLTVEPSHQVPRLYVFAISHYCEKARWALDYRNIPYDLQYVAPGEHSLIAKKRGARHSYVPFLTVNGTIVQGSAEVIDWAEHQVTSVSASPTPDGEREASLAIEKRVDDILGVHVRRYYYSEALVKYPQTVRPIFTRDLPMGKRLFLGIGWGKIRKLMIRRMDLGDEQGAESKDIVEKELDWVDDMLADGRSYLVGGRFSRADIAVASLLAPLVAPAQHPTYGDLAIPPGIASDMARWAGRPSLDWVRTMYAQHR